MSNSRATDQVKVWLFPTLVAILSTIIWSDVRDIKSDVKALMAQSNIDKTRIDNIEKQMSFFSPGAVKPMSFITNHPHPAVPSPGPREATLTKELYVDTRQKKYMLSYVKKNDPSA